jgi:hypothetical protein
MANRLPLVAYFFMRGVFAYEDECALQIPVVEPTLSLPSAPQLGNSPQQLDEADTPFSTSPIPEGSPQADRAEYVQVNDTLVQTTQDALRQPATAAIAFHPPAPSADRIFEPFGTLFGDEMQLKETENFKQKEAVGDLWAPFASINEMEAMAPPTLSDGASFLIIVLVALIISALLIDAYLAPTHETAHERCWETSRNWEAT